MPSIVRNPRRAAAVLALLAASAGALGGIAAAGPAEGPARCEIRVARQGGAVALTALASAETRVSGRYALRVSGRGTDIRQAGPFEAAPGRPATLGAVTLGANGSGYEAELDVTVDGDTQSCSKRIAGGI